MEGRRRGRGGFTLVEMLVVILIIGLLASIVLVNIHHHWVGSQVKITRISIRKLKSQVEIFYFDHNRYPDSIEEMVDDYIEEVPVDGWNREFIYHVPGVRGARFDIVSYGDDGQEGGEDKAADLWSSPAK